MEVLDILTDERKDVDTDKLVFASELSDDFIVSVPHAGLFIPTGVVDRFNVCKSMLVNTDMYTDRLFDFDSGIKVICRLNNYVVNMGRSREGGDTSLPAHLQRDPFSGIFLDGGKGMNSYYSNSEKDKMLVFYDEYHRLLEGAVEKLKKKGQVFILDGHSLNSKALSDTPDAGEERKDFNVGTLDGKACSGEIENAFCDSLEESGFTVSRNWPYKGGYITHKYANPLLGVNVIQLEVKKKLYYDECLDDSEGFKINEEELLRVNSAIKKAIDAAVSVLRQK